MPDLTEIASAIVYSYEAGDYPDDLSPETLEFLGPDGGLLKLLRLAEDQQARIDRAVAMCAADPDPTYWTGDSWDIHQLQDDLDKVLTDEPVKRDG